MLQEEIIGLTQDEIDKLRHETKEELTEDMHSEFTVSSYIEKKHKALSFWGVVGHDATKQELIKWLEIYEMSLEDVMKWKKYSELLDKKTEESIRMRKLKP